MYCCNLSRNSGMVAACTGVIEEKPSLWRVLIVDGKRSSEVHDVPPSLVLPIISSTAFWKSWLEMRAESSNLWDKNLIISNLVVYCLLPSCRHQSGIMLGSQRISKLRSQRTSKHRITGVIVELSTSAGWSCHCKCCSRRCHSRSDAAGQSHQVWK